MRQTIAIPEMMHPSEDFTGFSQNISHDYINRHNPEFSFPPPDSSNSLQWPERHLGATAVRYIFWRHTQENGPKLVEAVQGCDVLALEAMAITKSVESVTDFKLELNRSHSVINGLLGADLNPQEQTIFDTVSKNGEINTGTKEIWLHTLSDRYVPALKSLIDSGTRLVTLDVRAKHSQKIIERDKKRDEARRNVSRQILEAAVDFDTLKQSLLERVHIEMETESFRENLAHKQIEKTIEKYQGAKIAVVYGARHLLLTRMMNRPDVHTQRVFLGREQEPEYEHMKPAIDNADTVGSILRVCGQVPDSYLQREVLDRIAEWVLSKKKFLKYCELSESQKTERLEPIMELWQDCIAEDDPKFDKKTWKRLKTTKKILKP
jgi:hypothetical protein